MNKFAPHFQRFSAEMEYTTDYNASFGHCPFCSNPPYQYIHHGGHCPLMKAKEYYPNGVLKRIEFHDSKDRIPGLHQGAVEVSIDFDAPLDLTEEPFSK